MKKIVKNVWIAGGSGARGRANTIYERLFWAAAQEETALLARYGTAATGLTPEQVERSREEHGSNVLTYGKRESVAKRLFSAFINPFTVILLALAVISAVTDIALASPGEKNYATVLIIATMVLLSGGLRFVQETRSGNVADKLLGMLHTTACVERSGQKAEIPLEEIVAGDLVYLSAGDMIPADLRILCAKDLFLSQSALTGESEAVEKLGTAVSQKAALTDTANLAFLGSNVVSGSAKALVLAVGNNTMLGRMAKELNTKPPKTTFEKGVNSVSWVLIRFMLLMVPVVLLVNGFTKGDWMQASLFAISIAVGLTPEMLPMIVTASLAKGALAMSKQKVIIKNLNSIQNLGSMDILCTDKTGTLTQDKVVLEYHLNVDGKEDDRVLRHAFLNSYFQTGLKNLIDLAVIQKQEELGAHDLVEKYTKVDEIPFDFQRRRMSVVVQDREGKTQLVTKGAVEEMLQCCAWAECGGRVLPLEEGVRRRVLAKAGELNGQGMRVIAVAQKTNPSPAGQFSVEDERGMVLLGFLALLDPPKATAQAAIQALQEYGVSVKILTGDNEKVTQAICRQVGLPVERILLGTDLESLDDQTLGRLAEDITVFAKLSPEQKARVVRILREKGHTVGYMGDGINDAAAMKAADVGVSVDTAVDIAKETASVVLLEKDLMVLEQGVLEGRKTYANMMKYIKITASSNFGNMFSVLAASAFLPFLPMASLHLILLNLIYDVCCTALSWDNVDPAYLKVPRRWEAKGIGRFMLWIGPISSLFDIATYLLLYFVLCPLATGGQLYTQLADPAAQALYVALFQTGWFVESMWTQTLVIHMLRTEKLPFARSRASVPVALLSLAGIALVTAIPFTPLAAPLEMAALPPVYFLLLGMVVLGYMALVTVVKKRYIRRYGQWL
ncbi:magnesium-translocating P-type ATPase [Acutalibacter sp. LFL-21]|uniref:magnesium-translocating P-type ATPase n=1 Tax=Acutalibacter sp. LFL-21 TaxID=2983399 RepID=UPI0021D68D39|nr:magnesium-translocating P-type ATPase [Acutalibacter sp. LFL-21]MCU7652028.1 magnesium-translocating P-type ATPase [Acutalibacter sp. LFL-21]